MPVVITKYTQLAISMHILWNLSIYMPQFFDAVSAALLIHILRGGRGKEGENQSLFVG